MGECKEECGRWDRDWVRGRGGGIFDSWKSGVVQWKWGREVMECQVLRWRCFMGLIREWLLLLLVGEGSKFLKEPREGRHRVDIAVSLV